VSVCPDGWTQYQGWSTMNLVNCCYGAGVFCGGCQYDPPCPGPNACQQAACSNGQWANNFPTCLKFDAAHCSLWCGFSTPASAFLPTTTQIGCY
jgi:hypothetical protein